jgi:hypothetical protein
MRRAQLAYGLDAERGRPLELNGDGSALGGEPLANGD